MFRWRLSLIALLTLVAACTLFFDPKRPDFVDDAGPDGDSDADCIPECLGRECGQDGCGWECPSGCELDETCDEDAGVCICIPECTDRECGDDGCHGTCEPGCDSGQFCSPEGHCIDLVCDLNAGWGAACFVWDWCDDGTRCIGIEGLGWAGRICAPLGSALGSEDAACSEVSDGLELCALYQGENNFCGIFCDGSEDCPCGLSCRQATSGGWFCYP